MPKGKPWTVEEEKKLREMVGAGASIKAVAVALNKSEMAIRQKMIKLDLKEEKNQPRQFFSSSNLELPEDLPSVEEQLKVLAGALRALQTPGLGKTEVMRLANIIRGVEVYIARFADYVDYRGLERDLVEWEAKYAELAKKVSGFQGK